jgi:small multidrug resistance family-3 protein
VRIRFNSRLARLENSFSELGGLPVLLKTVALFTVTAIAEIVGCYLPYLWLKKNGSFWLLPIAAVSLALFAYLLTLHPAAAGRVYAAYGGVYVTVALFWLWSVDGIRPTSWDVAGVTVTLLGMGLIVWGGWQT